MKEYIPLVSIIVPVYNAEKDLDRCLNSLISLDYTNSYEVIVIDDGSQDNSRKICDRYKEKYDFIKVIHQENSGVSVARNVGIEYAVGKYIMFVDSDDYLSPSAIDRIIRDAKDNYDLVIYDSYFDTGECKLHSYPELKKIEKDEDISIDLAYSMFLKLQNNEPFSKLYATKVIKDAQVKFPINVSLGEDLIFTLHFLKKVQKVRYIPEPLYVHIDSADGLSKKNTSAKAISDYDAMYNAMLFFVSEINIGKQHYNEVLASILQSITNYSGKLYSNGYSKNDITEIINNYSWYDKILSSRYRGYKSRLRKVLLKNKCYYIISKIFNK